MNLVKAFAGALVPVMATIALGAAPAFAADPAPAPATTATTAPAPGGAMTKPTTKKPRAQRPHRTRMTAAQRAAWRKAHPNAKRRTKGTKPRTRTNKPKPAPTPTTKP
jgi:hypothetical protein